MSTPILLEPEDSKFRVWLIDELYFGGTAPNNTLYKPNINDKVVDYSTGEYRVIQVDADGIPTLELLVRYNQDGGLDLDSDSLLTALSHYQPTTVTPIYFDDSTTPHYTCTVDGAFVNYGVESERMIFFLGTDTSSNGTIISERYDGGGNLVDNTVDLNAIDPAQPGVKIPNTFATSVTLTPGDIVSGVAYKADGGVSRKTLFIVQASAANRPIDLSGVFIDGIRIKSDLLDPNDDTVILNDANTSFASSLVKAEILYSDGSVVETNIDGVKMKLLNIDQFDTTALIRPTSVVLAYYPDPNEPFINGVNNGGQSHITKVYFLANRVQGSDFGLKLYAIPRFISVAAGYQLEWRLVNLERDVDIDVTADVKVLSSSGGFLPANYGNEQNLTVSLNMDDVAPSVYNGHIHTQKVDIVVNIPGSNGLDAFVIDYNGDGINPYGVGLYAACSPGVNGKLNISISKATQTEWLSYLYNSAGALFDRSVLDEPPRPTHFRYEYQVSNSLVVSQEIPIDRWDENLDKVAGIPEWIEDSTVNIVWLIDNAGEWDVLGHSPLVIKLDLVL